MGWLDACGKDLTRKDFPSNCLLSSAQLNREYYYSWVFWLVKVWCSLFTFLSPKPRTKLFFLCTWARCVVMPPKEAVFSWWRMEKGRILEAK